MKNYINCLLIMMAIAGSAAAQTTVQNKTTGISAEQFISQAALAGMKEVAAGEMAKQKAQDTKIKSYGAMMVQDHGKANAELTAIAKARNLNLPMHDNTPASSGSGNIGDGAAPDGTQIGKNGTTGTSTTTGAIGTITNSNKNITEKTDNAKTMKPTNGQSGSDPATVGTNNSSDSLKMVTEADVNSAIQQLDTLSGAPFDTAYSQMMVADHKNAVALFEQGSQSSDPDIKAFATKYLPTLRNHLQKIQSISGTGKSGQ